MNQEFNLIKEPWILVVTKQAKVNELSLTDAILQSHKYVDLAGEMPAQDIAVLRVCLTVLYRTFYRYDLEGNDCPLKDEVTAQQRWNELWQLGHFPEKPIRQYLETYRDKFWLFDPVYPFYQTNSAKAGTTYSAAKLNGAISESNNKIRLFACRTGAAKNSLTYSEAARWLLFVNGYDDTSGKAKQKGLPSPGAGWLGRLGIIEVVGANLFETMMLNLVMLDDNGCLWPEEQPTWELDYPREEERTEIEQPKSPVGMMSIQSRRLHLTRSGTAVTGYTMLGGDFFKKYNAFAETMTVWSKVTIPKTDMEVYQPRRHDSGQHFWQEFGFLFTEVSGSNVHVPGVVRWVRELLRTDRVNNPMVYFRSISVQYGDKDFFITDAFSDSLIFHKDIFMDKNWEQWGVRLNYEIQKNQEIANCLEKLARNIALVDGFVRPERVVEQFFSDITLPFLSWLRSIAPEAKSEHYMEKRSEEWHKAVVKIAWETGYELVAQTPNPILGYDVLVNGKSFFVCPARAIIIFENKINEIYNDWVGKPTFKNVEACKKSGDAENHSITNPNDIGNQIFYAVMKKITEIEHMNYDERYSILVELRKGIGKKPGELPELWKLLITDVSGLSERFNYSEPTTVEWSVYMALVIYGTRRLQVRRQNDIHKEQVSLGMALCSLASKTDMEDYFLKELQKMSSLTEPELIFSQLYRLSKFLASNRIQLDYGKLAEDLYRLQNSNDRAALILKWGLDFYRRKK